MALFESQSDHDFENIYTWTHKIHEEIQERVNQKSKHYGFDFFCEKPEELVVKFQWELVENTHKNSRITCERSTASSVCIEDLPDINPELFLSKNPKEWGL